VLLGKVKRQTVNGESQSALSPPSQETYPGEAAAFLRRTESMHWHPGFTPASIPFARLVFPWTVRRVEDRHGQQHLDNQRR